MSMLGKLVFFTQQEQDQPQKLLNSVLTVMGATSFTFATRSVGVNNYWEKLQSELLSQQPMSSVPTEFVGEGLPLFDLHRLYKEPCSLDILLDSCPMSSQVEEAIRANISPQVRGEFCPGAPYVTIGFHDIYENAEHDQPFLFGRAFLSVRFFGYSTPQDWDRFREELFRIAEIRQIQATLESITGPLERCVFWDV
jgi:hypothetical protein